MLCWKLQATHRLVIHGHALCVSHHLVNSRGAQFCNSAFDSASPPLKPAVEKDLPSKKIHVVAELQRRLSGQDGTIDSSHISSIVKLLGRKGIPNDLIIETFTNQNALLLHDLATWKSTVDMVAQNGFNKGQILQLIASQPHILSGEFNSRRRLHQAISALRNLGFIDDHIASIVTENPDVISVARKLLAHNMASLRKVYRESSARAACRHHPEVLTRPPHAVAKVLDYCHSVMGVDIKEVLRANAFVYSLDHISRRHKFLAKCGLYERPNKHGMTNIENPSLQDILEMGDEQFAVKLGKVTLGEYRVFCQMLQQEEENAGDDEADEFDTESWDELFEGD